MVKIFLNVSKDEQARRFISRIDTPKKNWKFSSGDIDERAYWDEYMEAYETCINRTARENTPWYVVPADHKWYARLVISRIVLNELESMDLDWPVLNGEEMAKLQTYREMLVSEIEQPEDDSNEDDGKKLKPSDTAVGIALRSDRQALSEKKFRKLLKKSIFENFSARFGVSEKTQEQLGQIYLDIEEEEAKAEADVLSEVKEAFREKKNGMDAELAGFGKEARKLLRRYKKASRTQINAFIDGINASYAQYEEELKQIMIEYKIAVSSEGASMEDALKGFEEKLRSAFEIHRAASVENKEKTVSKLIEIADKFAEIGMAFRQTGDAEERGEELPQPEDTVPKAAGEKDREEQKIGPACAARKETIPFSVGSRRFRKDGTFGGGRKQTP